MGQVLHGSANARTVVRERLLDRVLAGLKHRLLAPELVKAFVAEYVAEVNAANRQRGQRWAEFEREHTRATRQIRNLLELMKDGLCSASMVQELRGLEHQQAELYSRIATAGTPEPLPGDQAPGQRRNSERQRPRLPRCLPSPRQDLS